MAYTVGTDILTHNTHSLSNSSSSGDKNNHVEVLYLRRLLLKVSNKRLAQGNASTNTASDHAANTAAASTAGR
jgi:hypothetical protein